MNFIFLNSHPNSDFSDGRMSSFNPPLDGKPSHPTEVIQLQYHYLLI